jgi:hypothetical protein
MSLEGNQNPTAEQKAAAEALKTQGNTLFTSNKFAEAIAVFTGAIALDGTNHVLFSNRSGAKLASGDAKGAAADAQRCIDIKSDWVSQKLLTELAFITSITLIACVSLLCRSPLISCRSRVTLVWVPR